MPGRRPKTGEVTLGADKGYDAQEFISRLNDAGDAACGTEHVRAALGRA